jgi:hypothetical protein
MIQQQLIWGYLLLCFVLATLPWVGNRLFLLKRLAHKNFVIRLLEWMVYAALALMAGWGLEWQLTGEIKSQDWEFYVSTLFMFIIMAFPGFIWYQQRKKQQPTMITE